MSATHMDHAQALHSTTHGYVPRLSPGAVSTDAHLVVHPARSPFSLRVPVSGPQHSPLTTAQQACYAETLVWGHSAQPRSRALLRVDAVATPHGQQQTNNTTGMIFSRKNVCLFSSLPSLGYIFDVCPITDHGLVLWCAACRQVSGKVNSCLWFDTAVLSFAPPLSAPHFLSTSTWCCLLEPQACSFVRVEADVLDTGLVSTHAECQAVNLAGHHG